MNEVEVLDALRGAGALLQGHFLLSSGRHSPVYLQCARVLQHPALAERLGRALASRWRARRQPAVAAVMSAALGGVIIGHEVGRSLGVRAVFAEREDGGMALRRGFVLEPGERVLVVEDVVTTGGSVRELVALSRAAGAVPAGVACIVHRGDDDPVDGLPLVALARTRLPTHPPERCPQCDAGEPLLKPGSRPGAAG